MKERFWRKILSVCLALLIIAALVPAQSISVSAYWDNYGQFSYEFTYVDRRWDYSQNKLVEEVKTHTGPYSELKYLWERWESSNLLYGICDVTPSDWYLVSWDVTISKRIDVIGNVNLVILDDHTVTFEDGIHVAPGSTLNIYGQSNNSGVLKAVADTNKQAAIGGNDGEACGTVNIYGSQVTADCYNYGNEAAGIGGGNGGSGGGDGGSGGNITIENGKVKGTGGIYYDVPSVINGGAGIGGGGGGNGGTIKIKGGVVEGHAGYRAAGIGGGSRGDCGTIEISGGTVTAVAGGKHHPVAVQGKQQNEYFGGAGIGNGIYNSGSTTQKITISGGNINARSTVGSSYGYLSGAGIGGSYGGNCENLEINITGCESLHASSDHLSAGIGSGGYAGNSGVSITISGGTITAYGGYSYSPGDDLLQAFGAGIGAGGLYYFKYRRRLHTVLFRR